MMLERTSLGIVNMQTVLLIHEDAALGGRNAHLVALVNRHIESVSPMRVKKLIDSVGTGRTPICLFTQAK